MAMEPEYFSSFPTTNLGIGRLQEDAVQLPQSHNNPLCEPLIAMGD